MNRWLMIGLVAAAVGFASWQWGFVAALPYLGFLICPLMCIGMGLFAYQAGSKSGREDKASGDSGAIPRRP